MRPDQRLWTRDFALVLVVNLAMAFIFYLLMTTMALYAAQRFGAQDSLAGFASSAFIVGAVAARAVGGKWLDVVGRRRTLLVSLVVFVVASLAYIPADSIGLLLTIRLLHGVAFGAGNTALATSVQTLIPPWRRSEGTGYFGLSATGATALGPLLAVLLVDSVGYEALFALCAGCSAVGLAVAAVLRLPERTLTDQEVADRWRLRPSDVVDPSALPIASIMLIAGGAYSGILAFLNSYARDLGAPAAAGGFFLAYALVVVGVRLVVGRIQDRRGDNAVMYPTILAFAAGLAVLGVATGPAQVVAAGVLVGCGFGALMPCAQAIAVASAPPERVAYATATFYLLLDVGTGVGPVLLGLVVAAAGFHTMYVVLAAVMLATTGLYHVVHGRRRVRPAGAGQG